MAVVLTGVFFRVCSLKCENTPESYVCSCPDPELNLAPGRRTCVGEKTLMSLQLYLVSRLVNCEEFYGGV